jgi:hypothetical protein
MRRPLMLIPPITNPLTGKSLPDSGVRISMT